MIRWITDRLGTAPWESAQTQSDCALLDVRDLVDKSGNFLDGIRCKIQEGVALLQQGTRLIVCCDYGMSRSNAIAAGILAASTPMPFDAAVGEVCRATGETAIRIEVLAAVRAATAPEILDARQRKTRRSVFVTGASGTIGSTLIARLAANWRVFAPNRSQLDLSSGTVELDRALRENEVDVVVHLANPRIVTTNRSLGESLVLLKNVVDACRLNRTRLVYLSCWEVFAGYRSTGMLVDEQTPLNPAGTYSQAKYLAELLIETERKQSGLPWTILRCGPIYGERSRKPRFIANYFEKALAGKTITTHCYRNGPPRLDLLHVNDLVEAIVAVIGDEGPGVFHVGPGVNYSTAEIAQLIVELAGSMSRIEKRDIDGFAPNVIMDASRLRSQFGWQPRMELQVGLRRIVELHMANSELAKRGAA